MKSDIYVAGYNRCVRLIMFFSSDKSEVRRPSDEKREKERETGKINGLGSCPIESELKATYVVGRATRSKITALQACE